MKVTVEAEVHKGVITKIRPVGCENCEPLKSKGKAAARSRKWRVKLSNECVRSTTCREAADSISHLSREGAPRIDFGPVLITFTGSLGVLAWACASLR